MSSPAPIQSPVGALESARRESQQAAYEQLHATLKELNRIDVPVLNDSHLQTLGIRKLPDIDVDEHAPFDPEPLFFSPYPFSEGEDMPDSVKGALDYPQAWYDDINRAWKEPCERSDCPAELIHYKRHCSCSRYDWVHTMAGENGDGVMGKTNWKYDK